jgi:hypothetical protein
VPTGIACVCVKLVRLICETDALPKFATYALAWAASSTAVSGSVPTAIELTVPLARGHEANGVAAKISGHRVQGTVCRGGCMYTATGLH